MKKYFKLLICALFIISLAGCVTKDAICFKCEYESLIGTKNAAGKDVRNITIPEDNPMIYKTADDIVNAVNNKESFIVYFGFSSCPWCRSVINPLLDVAKDKKIKKIYYVDVKEIRDVLTVDNEGNITTKTKGTDAYMELTSLFSNVLESYDITNDTGKTYETGEKRIYAPNVIVVKNGEAVGLSTGISDQETDPYMELSEEIINDTKNQFENLFSSVN